MVPNRERPRQPRPCVRQGTLRVRLRDAPRSDHDADDSADDHRSVAGGDLGRSDQPRRAASSGASRRRTARDSIGGITVVALHERGNVPRAEAGARRLRQQQRRHLRARLPLADRLRPEEHDRRIGRHAGVRLGHAGGCHHRRRRQSDRRPSGVRLAAEAAPAPGREADRDRSARDRAGAHAAHRGGLPPAAAARHERRAVQRARARRRHRGADEGRLRRRALRARLVSQVEDVRRRSRGIRPRPRQPETGVPPDLVREAARLYADGRQRRDLLRSRRHRAQPGHDDGDVHREPGDGDRQSRSRRRRRQPAARPEQRAGLVRHGIVPARVQRLPARLRSGGARAVRAGLGRPARVRARPAHAEHVRGGARRQLQGSLHPGRRPRAVRSRHAARHGGARGDGMRRRPGSLPERDREVRARVSARARRSSRRTARSRTPSGGSRPCAR